MVGPYFSHLFLVALDTPVCSDVVSVDEALFCLVSLGICEPSGEGADNHFPGDIHIYQLVISQIYLIASDYTLTPPSSLLLFASAIRLLLI